MSTTALSKVRRCALWMVTAQAKVEEIKLVQARFFLVKDPDSAITGLRSFQAGMVHYLSDSTITATGMSSGGRFPDSYKMSLTMPIALFASPFDVHKLFFA